MDETRGIPGAAWIASLAAAAAGIALAVLAPGDVAFWLSPPLVIPVLCLGVLRFLDPWSAVPVRRRRAAAAGATLSACAGAALLLAAPGDRSYLVAGLLVLPLMGVIVAWEEDGRRRAPNTGDPALGLPDLPDAPGGPGGP